MIWVSILEGLFVIMLVAALIVGLCIDIKRWKNTDDINVLNDENQQEQSIKNDNEEQ